MLQKAFSGRANADSPVREAALQSLVQHEIPAFELLWYGFQVQDHPASRLAVLNTLQHLISRIKRPKQALRFLLGDFCRQSDRVAPSDRFAIMLSNILLRTYNKELGVDIDMTPEEVLNVRNGLDEDMVRYAQFRIDALDDRFAEKVRRIHARLVSRIIAAGSRGQSPSVRGLMLLEREIYIFLALLSGQTARRLLIRALTEYGDPLAGIYRHFEACDGPPPDLLGQLKIAVRGLGRVGMPDDVGLLLRVCTNSMRLAELNGASNPRRAVGRITEWVENAIRNMTAADIAAPPLRSLSA
jgi:hypothetical protein